MRQFVLVHVIITKTHRFQAKSTILFEWDRRENRLHEENLSHLSENSPMLRSDLT